MFFIRALPAAGAPEFRTIAGRDVSCTGRQDAVARPAVPTTAAARDENGSVFAVMAPRPPSPLCRLQGLIGFTFLSAPFTRTVMFP
jgi:hypothetical protein